MAAARREGGGCGRVKVAGAAAAYDGEGGSWIRITPETTWSCGLNLDAETHFGPIEKRHVTS